MQFIRIVRYSFVGFAVAALLADAQEAPAAMTFAQAKATCHDQFVSIVRECVHRKMTESGGNPYKYIPGCRAAIMDKARQCVAKLMGGNATPEGSATAAAGPAEIDLPASSGKGRIVVMLSGVDGTLAYVDYAAKVSKLGYYTVILDGKDILSGVQGSERLREAIIKAQNSPNAVPGKVAVIGFSLGGGGALTYAERQPDLVSTVISYYPVTSFLTKQTDMKTFVGKFQVPLLVFAGAQDSYNDCCLLATIKAMQAAAKELGKSVELVVYPDAGHNFIKEPDYNASDADDAWRRTGDVLNKYLSSAKVH
jgi:pimeloyl-ACP methyl ester carboxylesterase